MTERQRRDRVHDQRPPSRHMRSLLRQALFGIYRLKRECEQAATVGPRSERQMRRVLELCRRATARDSRPDWFVPLTRTMPQTIPDTVAALNRLLVPLRVLDGDWRRRLVAAGIDPEWPGDDA